MRIAPNNSLPSTHFIEVWNVKGRTTPRKLIDWDIQDIKYFREIIDYTSESSTLHTIAIFRIRENKLPTLHNFKPTQQ